MPLGHAPIGDVYEDPWKALGGWFLGPRAENADVFMSIFQEVFEEHVRLRKNYFPADPEYLTEEIKRSAPYLSEVEDTRACLMKMQEDMAGNTPFFSPRYQAHMLWDTTMPSLLGYMTAMLFNQNNVDSAASPVTTLYEHQVAQQLCDMLGYNINPRRKGPLSWGHITSGGSVANIEALWASRNLKFLPLSVKSALMNEDPKCEIRSCVSKEQVEIGLQTPVLVYNKDEKCRKETALGECTTWQLLNMDVDEICDLEQRIYEKMQSLGTVEVSKIHCIIKAESIMSIGMLNFFRKHNLNHSPVYTCPANNHYSWSKAGTLLGLGYDSNIPIALDTHFRQNLKHLEEVLERCLNEERPVIASIAVIGSTEESAVDPIKAMYELRESFKNKGLNFALLADAAWGGYFKTMLIGAPVEDEILINKTDGFVPYCKLSPYVQEQYENIQLADTITIDPHKSGFCPYPGGALCYRNSKMRLTLATSYCAVIMNGDDDPNLSVFGVEGSKPGAAPAGILMSHRVIGLSNFGYGRILGQCTSISKLFYAMWLTVARDDDPFVCVPLQDVPEGYDVESAKKLVMDKIAYKPLSEIFLCKEAKDFLTLCGPDTMINTFVVNFKGNKDVAKCNKLQLALSDAMNIFVGSDSSRVPLMLMQSSFGAKAHGEGLLVFKKKLGLYLGEEDLNVMVNTCMNPWQSNESAFEIGDLLRNIVLNAMGRIEDEIVPHRFVHCDSKDSLGESNTIYLEYLTCSDILEHHYQASIKVQMSNSDKEMVKKYRLICKQNGQPVVFETVEGVHPKEGSLKLNLYDLLHRKGIEVRMRFFNDPAGNMITFKVVDMPRFQRLDPSSYVSYPEKQKYFIFGDPNTTVITHLISKFPDFQHTALLKKRPDYLTEQMLHLGVLAEVQEIEDSTLPEEKTTRLHLQDQCSYIVKFKGELGATIHTTIKVRETVHFAELGSVINGFVDASIDEGVQQEELVDTVIVEADQHASSCAAS
ncbi:hypothetical protein ACHWQZ_G005893 [Mnemiopsis leidyi]